MVQPEIHRPQDNVGALQKHMVMGTNLRYTALTNVETPLDFVRILNIRHFPHILLERFVCLFTFGELIQIDPQKDISRFKGYIHQAKGMFQELIIQFIIFGILVPSNLRV